MKPTNFVMNRRGYYFALTDALVESINTDRLGFATLEFFEDYPSLLAKASVVQSELIGDPGSITPDMLQGNHVTIYRGDDWYLEESDGQGVGESMMEDCNGGEHRVFYTHLGAYLAQFEIL